MRKRTYQRKKRFANQRAERRNINRMKVVNNHSNLKANKKKMKENKRES